MEVCYTLLYFCIRLKFQKTKLKLSVERLCEELLLVAQQGDSLVCWNIQATFPCKMAFPGLPLGTDRGYRRGTDSPREPLQESSCLVPELSPLAPYVSLHLSEFVPHVPNKSAKRKRGDFEKSASFSLPHTPFSSPQVSLKTTLSSRFLYTLPEKLCTQKEQMQLHPLCPHFSA